MKIALCIVGGFMLGVAAVVGFIIWAAWQKVKHELPSD